MIVNSQPLSDLSPIQYLRNFLEVNSFKALYDTFGINARASKDLSKWSLNYDQIASKPGCRIAAVCRGIVIRPVTTVTDENQVVGPFHIVARGMDRFYNAGESHAAEIDWKTARIEEKVDGTMALLYWDDVKLEWCVATRSVPEADVSFGDPPGSPLPENTFSQLFWYALEKTLEGITVKTFLDSISARHTYVFELTSPLNRVVVKYDDYSVTILAIRNLRTGEYLDTSPMWEIPRVCNWSLQTLSDLTDFVNNMDPAKCEGAVVVDSNWNRIKVKNKAWVLASRAKDMVTMSKRNALECIIQGKCDDVIPLLDTHVAEYLHKLQSDLRIYCTNVDASVALFTSLYQTRKDFALAVKAAEVWPTPFFSLYNNTQHTNCIDWLRYLSKTETLTPTVLDQLLTQIDK